jgi:RNA polymerase sigma-70 factor (ECF subfamily)
LARRYAPDVDVYLRRRMYPLPESDVDDLVQSVFIVAWRRLDLIPEGDELPWLIGVARNVLNNARRSHSRRQSRDARQLPRLDEPSAEEVAISDVSLRVAIHSLNASDRELLFLHLWEGLDAHQIAVALDLRPGAAATRLSRARSRFREAYRTASVTSA